MGEGLWPFVGRRREGVVVRVRTEDCARIVRVFVAAAKAMCLNIPAAPAAGCSTYAVLPPTRPSPTPQAILVGHVGMAVPSSKPTSCPCRPCTHPGWKKPCAFKRAAVGGGAAPSGPVGVGSKPWEASPDTADGFKLLELCGYGVDSAAATWRKLKQRRRQVPWPEALEVLRELSKARSSRADIAEARTRVLADLEAHLAATTKDPASAASSSASSPGPPAHFGTDNATDNPTSDPPAVVEEGEAGPNAENDPPAASEQRVDLPQALAKMLGCDDLPKVRKTPNDEYSLMDIGMAITGKDAHDAAQDLRIVIDRYPEFANPEVGENLSHFQFSGQGQRIPTKVGKLAKVVEYIMLLPGKTAARVRVKAATILVRYLGGDLKLIDEVRALRRVQEHLAEVDPHDWRRAFGEAVEQDTAAEQAANSPAKKILCSTIILRVHDDILASGGDPKYGDLYLMHVGNGEGHLVAWKVGRSDNPLQRAVSLDNEAQGVFDADWRYGVADIVRGAGCLERFVLRKLSELKLPDCGKEYFQPAEHFRDLFLLQCRAAERIWAEQCFQKDRKARADEGDDGFEKAMKRARIELDLRREQLKLRREQLVVYNGELDAQERELNIREKALRIEAQNHNIT